MVAQFSIFRAGTHTANSGQTIAFSQADLEATVNAYDPARHEAPLVVGHPKADAPAYGWVKSLAFSDGEVSAEPHQVDAAFQEMVRDGRFKKISASFYLPDAPQNPVKGVYYLRHVGFLGAQPPAVKGLKDASFTDGEEGVVEFGDVLDRDFADLFRTLREWIISQFGLEAADQALPGWEVRSVETQANAPAEPAEPSGLAYSETNTTKETAMEAKAKEALDAKAAELAAREQQLKAKEKEASAKETASFCDELVRQGRISPTHAKSLRELLPVIGDLPVVEFGEGQSETPLARLKSFLQSLPKQVDFSELKQEAAPTSVSFTAAPGYTVDAAGLELHAKAEAYRKANPHVTFIEAVKAVQ